MLLLAVRVHRFLYEWCWMFAIHLVNAVPKILCEPEQVSRAYRSRPGESTCQSDPRDSRRGTQTTAGGRRDPASKLSSHCAGPLLITLHLAFDKGLRVRDLV